MAVSTQSAYGFLLGRVPRLVTVVIVSFCLAALMSLGVGTARAITWDDFTIAQQEEWRQAVEEGGTKTPTIPVSPSAVQLYLDARSASSPVVRQLFFRLRQKAGVLPRPRTIGWVDLDSNSYTTSFTVGIGNRTKSFRFRVDPAPASGPPFSPYGLSGVDRCGYLFQSAGFVHDPMPYFEGEQVEACPDRTVPISGYYWPDGRRAGTGAGPTPPDDGYVLTKASNRTDYSILRWNDNDRGCENGWGEPAGFEPVKGGWNSGCFGPQTPNCTPSGSHACYPHAHGRYLAYFKEYFGALLEEYDGHVVGEGDQERGFGSEPGPVDRQAIDREMRDPKNQPLVDWLHFHEAQRLRPNLMFDTDEHWRPLEIGRFLGEGHGVCRPPETFPPDPDCSPLTTTTDLHAYTGSEDYIDINGEGTEGNFHSPLPGCNTGTLRDCDTGDVTAIYYHVTDPSPNGYRYFNYWFFYRYNDYADITSTDHEGDWEDVSVAPSATTLGTFDFVVFSQHGGHHSYLRDVLMCDTGATCGSASQKTGARVSVFVAAGSHANFPDQTGGQLLEGRHNGGTPWGENGNPERLILLPPTRPTPSSAWSDGPREWTDWPGIWGSDGDKPRSPGDPSRPEYGAPWTGVECEDESSCPKRPSGTKGPARDTTDTASVCARWFGEGLAAAACNPRELKQALARRRLGRRGAFRFARLGRGVSASAPGLAQVRGRPLAPGTKLTLAGRTSKGTSVVLRIAGRSGALYEASFRNVRLRSTRGKAVIAVSSPRFGTKRRSAPAVTLILPDRGRIRPTRLRLAGRSR